MSDIGSMTINDLQEMLSKLGNMATQPDNTTQSQPERVRLNKAIGEWIEHYQTDPEAKELSASSLRNYESHVSNFVGWTDFVSVDEITKSTIIDYRDYLHKEKGLKPATCNTIIIALNQYFIFCVDKGYCKKNPASRVLKVKQDPLQPKSLDDSTVNRLRNAITLNCDKRNDNTHLMIFEFQIRLGLRISEVLNLRFQDVSLDGKYPTLNVIDGKGGKDREVVMTPELVEIYKQYKSGLHRSHNLSQPIFQHHGQSYQDTAVRTFYWRLCKEHGIPHVHPHALRHSYAVQEINKGTPQTILQNNLGHASFSTTARYAMPSLNDKAAAAGYTTDSK